MARPKTAKARGILNHKAGEKKFQLSRYFPSPDLAFFIEHYWIVSWDLRGQPPYLQEILPHPSVHLTFEKDNTRVTGVVNGKFSYTLQGAGRVFGVKFRPGAFYPFVKFPISELTGSSISLQTAFGVDPKELETEILGAADEGQMVALAEAFLRQHLPEQDENINFINDIIDYIIADREINKVEDIAVRFNLNTRKLQRLFSQYVGVSPKWVIKRCRLHEAAEQLVESEASQRLEIVSDLGYFDQSHFIKDFRSTVGSTPAEYARNVD